jgi:O-antigen/teichoic acid export membrane protein
VKRHHRSAIALFDQGAVSLTSFLTALLIGRTCGKAELGLYTLAWTLLSVSSELSGALITTPYTVFSPRLSRGRNRRYLGSMLVHQAALTLFASSAMIAVLIAGCAAGWLSKKTAMLFTVSAVALVLMGLKEFARRVSFARLRIGSALAADMIASVLQLGGMVVMWRAGILNLVNTLMLLGVSAGAAAGWWLWTYRQEFRLQPRLFYSDLAGNWRFSRWVLGSGFLSSVARYVFPWILAAYHGSSATGVWASCSSLVAMCNPVVVGLSNYALPRISTVYAQSGRAAMRRKVNSFSVVLALTLLPVVITLSGVGERLVTRVFGPAFTGTSVILSLLAWNLLVNSMTNPYSQGLFTLNRAKEDTAINAAWVGILLAAGVFAVRSYSALGAAATLLASSVLTALIRTVYFWNTREPHSQSACAARSTETWLGRGRDGHSSAVAAGAVPRTAQTQ